MILFESGKRFGRALHASGNDSVRVCRDLFKTLIPIIVVVKLLSELGVIRYLALPLQPVMALVGLPPELGLAWAASLLVNIYSGMVVLLGLLPTLPPLSVAQITTLSLMILIAHNLILETRLAVQCGVAALPQLGIRMGMAIVGGMCVYGICQVTGSLAEPAVILLEQRPAPSLAGWAGNELLNLGKIFCIVWALLLVQRGLDYFRVTYWTGKVLHPVLRLLGISPDAATIIIVGFSMGLIYGSGIIIKDARSGRLSPHDVFCSLSIMGVAHALIEDTLLMLVLGANLWGILGLRLLLGMALNLLYAGTRLTRRAA